MLRELTVEELCVVFGGDGDDGGSCNASDPTGMGAGVTEGGGSNGLSQGCIDGITGGMVAGMAGFYAGPEVGWGTMALGAFGGAVAGGCFSGGSQ